MHSHQLDEDFSEVDYVAFKDNLEQRVQGINEFKGVAAKVDPQLANKVVSNLGDSLKKLRQANPVFAQQYDDEISKPLKEAECAKRWDICQISASVFCCIPSYTLLCLHLCVDRSYSRCPSDCVWG